MVAWKNVAEGLVALAVIVVIIVIVFLFYQKVLPFLKGEEITPETEEDAKRNFDMFIENIETCQKFNKTNCICEVFPTWPATFPEKGILKIETIGKRSNFHLKYENILKSASIEGLKMGAMKASKEKLPFIFQKEVNFKTEPPIYRQEGIGGWRPEWFVVSNYLYKDIDGLYLIIGKEETQLQIPKCSE